MPPQLLLLQQFELCQNHSGLETAELRCACQACIGEKIRNTLAAK